jgi:large repetitive protein
VVTTITSSPSGTVSSLSATFGFEVDEAGATFECRLDAGSWVACTSPQTYTNLSDGAHTLAARATDAPGNVRQAATRSWTVRPSYASTLFAR